jgi:hypothetical protein
MKIFFIFIFFFLTVSAQQTEIKIEDVQAELNQAVTVPLKVKDFLNIGAISLKIKYDNTTVLYKGYANTAVNMNINETQSMVILGWFDQSTTNPLNIPEGNLVDLRFEITNGGSLLEFLVDQCEINDIDGNKIDVNYQNGSISLITNINEEKKSKLTSFLSVYPNPFNGMMKVNFIVSGESSIGLKILDITGSIIKSLNYAGTLSNGSHTETIDLSNHSSGLYFCILRLNQKYHVKKVLLLK